MHAKGKWRVLTVAIGLVAAAFFGTPRDAAAAPGGTQIVNSVTATYVVAGSTFTTTSNTVTAEVAKVGALVVSPKETQADPSNDGFPTGTAITRKFVITNTSNIADAYTLTSVTSRAGKIASIAFVDAAGNSIPVTPNATVSPTLQPGQSLFVIVSLTTTGIPAKTAFPIDIAARTTATGTANGVQSDTGRQYGIANAVPSLGGADGNTAIQKTVDGMRSESRNPGDIVSYKIKFQNSGGSPATNVVISDPFPDGITPIASSVTVNGLTTGFTTSTNGQLLKVMIPSVAAGAVTEVSASGTVGIKTNIGSSIINTAIVSADGLPPIATTPADVLVGVSDVVYDGVAGQSQPVVGASVLLADPTTLQAISLPPNGIAPNLSNANPYVTGADGRYSFNIDPLHIGTGAVLAAGRRIDATSSSQLTVGKAVFDIIITAPGYRPRAIQVTLAPDSTGQLYDVTLQQTDGQPLAVAGGFGLITGQPVTMQGVFNLLGNQPMFKTSPITISKVGDRGVASGGDHVTFTVTVGNGGATDFGATQVIDTLPAGLGYVTGSARVDGVPVEPALNGRVLTWSLPALAVAKPHIIKYGTVVLANSATDRTLRNVVTATAAVPYGTATVTAMATADVLIVGGIFSGYSAITGRVFIDVNRTGFYGKHDAGVPGVRIFMESGESVVTDRDGRYSFPTARGGMHVLRLDQTTLPAGVRSFAERRYDSPRSATRLVHGVFDAGMLQDINFAVEAF